jgi:hypothetical protein
VAETFEFLLKDTPEYLLEQITSVLHSYSTALVRLHSDENGKENALHIGAGTFVSIGNLKGILTATHVVEKLEARSSLGLVASREGQVHRFIVPMSSLSIVSLGKRKTDDFGPDLALSILADARHVEAIKPTKGFWPLINDNQDLPSNNQGIWFMCGTPEERVQEETPQGSFRKVWSFENFCGGGGPDREFEADGNDYYEFPIDVAGGVPQSFSGMSGGAVWQVTIRKERDGQLKPVKYYFSGLIFFEGYREDRERFLRAHGRNSIRSLLSRVSR